MKPLLFFLSASTLSCFLLAAPSAIQARPDQDDDEKEEKDDEDKKKKKKKKKKKDPNAREIDTSSPEAKALKDMLQVEANYSKKDKQVRLTYNFSEESQLLDWTLKGFDSSRIDYSLNLGAGSRRTGVMLHRLHMKGNYEVEFKSKVEWTAPSSKLVFLFGNGKSGAIWGNALARKSRRGYSPISRKLRPNKRPWNAARNVKLKYRIKKGKEISCWVNGAMVGSTKKLKKKLDGRIGIWMGNTRLVVESITIKGEIDGSKL